MKNKLGKIVFVLILLLCFKVKLNAQDYVPKNWESFKNLSEHLTDSSGYVGRLYQYGGELWWNDKDGDLSQVSNQLTNELLYYTPEAYGAEGDGVTDDTSAFASIISTMGSNDGVIYIANTYYLNTANGLTFTNKIKIFGPGGFIIGSGVGNHAAITIEGDKSYLADFDMLGDHTNFLNSALTVELRRSIKITANYVTCDNLTDTNSIVGIELSGNNHCIIKNCVFTNSIVQAGPGTNNYHCAIRVNGSSDNKIIRNKVSGYGNGILHGGSSYRNIINNNQFYRPDNNSIYISSGQWAEICGNIIRETDDNGIKARDSYHLIYGNMIDQNSWTGGLIGIGITGNGTPDGDGFNGEGTLVIGNIIKGRFTAALRMNDQDNGYLRNPCFMNNIVEMTGDANYSLYGVHIKGRTVGSVIRGNVIKNAVYGIYFGLDDPNTDFHREALISDNQLWNNITYGIIGAKLTESTIANNFVEGDTGTLFGIYTASWNDDPNEPAIISIQGNHCKGPYNSGIYVEAQEGYYLENVNISNNNVEIESGGAYGIRVTTESRDMKIIGNRVTGQSIGIYISVLDPNTDAHTGMLVSNNNTCSGSNDGIVLSYVNDSLITDNISINNAANRTGITLGDCLRNKIINNFVGDTQGVATQRNGIEEQGTSDYNMIIDNDAEGLTNSGIYRYIITGENSVVETNRVSVQTASGNITFEIGEAKTYFIDPNGGNINFDPRAVTWPMVNELILINTANGAETITFDSGTLSQAVNQNERGIFAYDGANWYKIYTGS